MNSKTNKAEFTAGEKVTFLPSPPHPAPPLCGVFHARITEAARGLLSGLAGLAGGRAGWTLC